MAFRLPMVVGWRFHSHRLRQWTNEVSEWYQSLTAHQHQKSHTVPKQAQTAPWVQTESTRGMLWSNECKVQGKISSHILKKSPIALTYSRIVEGVTESKRSLIVKNHSYWTLKCNNSPAEDAAITNDAVASLAKLGYGHRGCGTGAAWPLGGFWLLAGLPKGLNKPPFIPGGIRVRLRCSKFQRCLSHTTMTVKEKLSDLWKLLLQSFPSSLFFSFRR